MRGDFYIQTQLVVAENPSSRWARSRILHQPITCLFSGLDLLETVSHRTEPKLQVRVRITMTSPTSADSRVFVEALLLPQRRRRLEGPAWMTRTGGRQEKMIRKERQITSVFV